MKLFTVSIEVEIVVLAEDGNHAIDIAEGIYDNEAPDFYPVEVNPRWPLFPPGWDENTLVYHDGKEDLRLGEALEQIRAATDKEVSQPSQPDSNKPPLSRGS